MFSEKHPRKPLSALEHLVMEAVWRRGTASTEDICEELAGRHPVKESTARTILSRLEEKGYVAHHVDGRSNIYSGLDGPQNVAGVVGQAAQPVRRRSASARRARGATISMLKTSATRPASTAAW